jgi:hypothetical protein
MSGKTCVWVQGSVLAKALGQQDSTKASHKKDLIDLDRTGGNWAWARCFVVSGDISSGNLTLEVVETNSEFAGQSVEIPEALLKTIAVGASSQTAPVVMANEWAASEVGDTGSLQDAANIPDDLITLTHLHEPSVVYCLQRRYEQDLIYTSTGPILIALNPFKGLPDLYDDRMMGDHWLVGEKLADLPLRPHVYASAHAAFRAMMLGIEMKMSGITGITPDQAMLVSGESGAGKTVTTKHIMKYLATLSQRKAEFSKRRRAASPGRSEARLRPSTAVVRTSRASRASRAHSWMAGALIEERSTYTISQK